MIGSDLHSFVTRSRALLEGVPPETRRETRTWLVEPFLEYLGWRVHDDGCLRDRSVDGAVVEYVLATDSTPAVLVAVEPRPEPLRASRSERLLGTMAWTGIDRAIYTNGDDYRFLAGTTDAEALSCRLSALPEREPILEGYTRSAARRRLDGDNRSAIARQVAVARPAITRTVVDRLVAEAGTDRYADAFEAATERFLDRLVVSFGKDAGVGADETGVSLEYADPSAPTTHRSADDGTRSEPATTHDASDGGDAPTARADADGVEDTAGRDADEHAVDEDDVEYVVRFFGERGSVGALGHATPADALCYGAEFCLDHGLAAVAVPWQPSKGDDGTVLNDEPTRADGSAMATPVQLSNGYYLETDGSADRLAHRLERLAEKSGLRAMLTGGWGERRD